MIGWLIPAIITLLLTVRHYDMLTIDRAQQTADRAQSAAISNAAEIRNLQGYHHKLNGQILEVLARTRVVSRKLHISDDAVEQEKDKLLANGNR